MKLLKAYILQNDPFIGALVFEHYNKMGQMNLLYHYKLPKLENTGTHNTGAWGFDEAKEKLINELEVQIKDCFLNEKYKSEGHRLISFNAKKLIRLIKEVPLQQELF